MGLRCGLPWVLLLVGAYMRLHTHAVCLGSCNPAALPTARSPQLEGHMGPASQLSTCKKL